MNDTFISYHGQFSLDARTVLIDVREAQLFFLRKLGVIRQPISIFHLVYSLQYFIYVNLVNILFESESNFLLCVLLV